MRLHEKEWKEYLEHTLTVVYVVSVTIELHDPHGIAVEPLCVLKDGCPGDITSHLLLKLPLLANSSLLTPKLLYVFLYFLAE